MALYSQTGFGDSNAAFWARFRQLDTDVTRLLRQVADMQDLPQLQFGAPDMGGSSSGGLLRARLTGPLTRSQSAAASLQDGAGSITVYGDQWRGYGFPGDDVDVRWHVGEQKWYAVGAGDHYCTGTLNSNLSKGDVANLSVDGGGTVAVFGQWGDSNSGAVIGALWNERRQRWDASLESCD